MSPKTRPSTPSSDSADHPHRLPPPGHLPLPANGPGDSSFSTEPPLPQRIAEAFFSRPDGGEVAEDTWVSVTDLRQMSRAQLQSVARHVLTEPSDDLSTEELIYRVLLAEMRSGKALSGEGTLQILPDGFGFLRSTAFHYLSCPDDIYVSPSQIRKFGLRTGNIVRGKIRPPKTNERYFALLRVHSVNQVSPDLYPRTPHFDSLTPLHPDKRIKLEYDSQDLSTRVVDLMTPIGFGQRGLIVSPPRAGKTLLMQAMARAVIANYPAAYVIMLLIDERPEEVTDMEREAAGPRCEVVSSTFDEVPERHIQVAEMVMEKAKRMVELGTDVIIFLDSITRLARAYNSECESSGKTLSGGLDAHAIQPPKAFFGSARKAEEGGTLTIVATALVNTGSRLCDVVFEEFKGTGNMEIVLDRSLVERRVWPAIELSASGTRREEKLIDTEDYRKILTLRRQLHEMNPADAMETLIGRLKKYPTNREFLASIRISADS